jgi:regulator of ribonuclease activity A
MSTADLVDRYGDGLDSIAVQFRSFGQHRRFSGPVQTVKCFEDNALVKATLSDPDSPAWSGARRGRWGLAADGPGR